MTWLRKILKIVGSWLEGWARQKQRERGDGIMNPESAPTERVRRHEKMLELIRLRQVKLWQEKGGFTPANKRNVVPIWAECRGCGRKMLVKRVSSEVYRAAPLRFQKMVESVLRKHRELDCSAVRPTTGVSSGETA